MIMKIFSWNDIQTLLNTGREEDFFSKACGISIGSFDGLHKGHRLLLSELKAACRKENLNAGLVTFKRPLPSIKHSKDYNGDITSLNQSLRLFEEEEIDFVIVVDFDESFASMLGADFLSILMNICNMKLIAEGEDFRCGYKGATDAEAIKYFAQKNNLKTIFVEPVYDSKAAYESQRISSSYIRSMIQKGFFESVKELLCRPYEIDLENVDFTEKGKAFIINKKDILQVLPPKGIYHVKDSSSKDFRICIKDESIELQTLKMVSKILFD